MPQMSSNLSPRNLALMYLGALCGTELLFTAYISFAEAAPGPAFRHMVPARLYLFSPFFALWAFAVGVIVEVFWFRRGAQPINSSVAWLVLGFAYSLVWLMYGLPGISQSFVVVPLSYAAAFACACLIHLAFRLRNAA